MKFTEEKLEQAFIKLLGKQEIPHVSGKEIIRKPEEVLLKDDLRNFYSGNNVSSHHKTDSDGNRGAASKQIRIFVQYFN